MYFLHILIVPSSSPQSVTAIATSSTSITVTWEGIPQKNKNGVIIAYEVEFTAATISVENTTVLEPPLSLELTGLYEAEIYRIRVRGYTSVGPGPFSSPLEEETPEDRTYLELAYLTDDNSPIPIYIINILPLKNKPDHPISKTPTHQF